MTASHRPLSARSLVLSLLLGAHPPELSARDLVRAVEVFGISEATLRVALSRMVGAGDLHRTDSGYRLSARLLERQRRQDESVEPETRPWRDEWDIVVITAIGRSPADRAELRGELSGLRLAELREGVWLRPANLSRRWPSRLSDTTTHFIGQPDDHNAAALARRLWDLDRWAAEGRDLVTQFATATQSAARIAAAAAIVRHLLADPVLPAALLPTDWPGPELRGAYRSYQAELIDTARGLQRSDEPA